MQGSVTTPGGSKRFGSFAGRFALASSNPNNHRELLDNYDLLSPEQLRAGARKMRTELDNLYKAGHTLLNLTSPKTGVIPSCALLVVVHTALGLSVMYGTAYKAVTSTSALLSTKICKCSKKCTTHRTCLTVIALCCSVSRVSLQDHEDVIRHKLSE